MTRGPQLQWENVKLGEEKHTKYNKTITVKAMEVKKYGRVSIL